MLKFGVRRQDGAFSGAPGGPPLWLARHVAALQIFLFHPNLKITALRYKVKKKWEGNGGHNISIDSGILTA